jgi:hypothetical protein
MMYGQVRQSTPHVSARYRMRRAPPDVAVFQLPVSAHIRSSPLIAAHRRTSPHIAARRNVAARCIVVTRRFTLSLSACRRMLLHVACRRCLMSPHGATCCCMMLHDTL